MSEEEYYRSLEEAEDNYAKGNYDEMKPGESLEDFSSTTSFPSKEPIPEGEEDEV